MPLGKISSSQIKKAYSILTDLKNVKKTYLCLCFNSL